MEHKFPLGSFAHCHQISMAWIVANVFKQNINKEGCIWDLEDVELSVEREMAEKTTSTIHVNLQDSWTIIMWWHCWILHSKWHPTLIVEPRTTWNTSGTHLLTFSSWSLLPIYWGETACGDNYYGEDLLGHIFCFFLRGLQDELVDGTKQLTAHWKLLSFLLIITKCNCI